MPTLFIYQLFYGINVNASLKQLQTTTTESAISYPNLDEPPPPSYDVSVVPPPSDGSGVGQLIDLGTDISEPAPTTSQTQGDIVSQLAQLGITAQPAPNATAPSQPPQQSDEFDVFARSRTAYATEQ